MAVTGLIPGDNPATLSGDLTGATNTYPLLSTGTDKGGRKVPIVTTGGNYGYLGRVTLAVTGTAVSVDVSSGPQLDANTSVDATHDVTADATVTSESVDSVVSYVAGLAADKRAETSVQMLQGGSGVIRSRQTNLGALVADALLHTAQQRADGFGVDSPQIALVNGGGIRATVAAGSVTTKSTFDASPFGNFVSVVEDLRPDNLKLLLENAYSKTTENTATPGVIDAVGTDGRAADYALQQSFQGTRISAVPEESPCVPIQPLTQISNLCGPLRRPHRAGRHAWARRVSAEPREVRFRP